MAESEKETRDDSESSSTATEKGSEQAATPPPGEVQAVQAPATTADQSTTGKTREDRSNWMEGLNKTFQYINKASRDKSLHFRGSDRITSRLLIAALVGALIFATFPFFEMQTAAAVCYVLADALLLGAILVFVISRFGIIRAMEPRHAIVCWHLMVGTGLLALVIGFNLVAAVVLFMLREKLQILLGG